MAAPLIQLNDGNKIPQLGLGVWQMPEEDAPALIKAATDAGYRHFDTAARYENEAGIGRGIRDCGIPREDLWITTKVWNDHQGYDRTLTAFDESMKKLGLEVLDLYLIHWAMPARDTYIDTWKALIELQTQGRVRSIGVSNFTPDTLTRLIDATGVVPVLNQIELHPAFQQREMRALHDRLGIKTECWSPLGQSQVLSRPELAEIGEKHGKSPAQIALRWHVQNDLIVIPKSANPERIAANIDVFDFTLDAEDMAKIATLDRADGRIGPDPATADFT
ncbi:aldo/keto reductase [Thioclava sp. 'Guangxiensis']|uniref:aldo/keto reductase n=1 Tax=Thioclava sp. 'Guangxiensis' TaxID=3149044 RepID=UPI0038783017